ncbi:GNAT family N-acetyltransferase [Actinacidiphila guanduensis]|uniref:Predicted N-acetyltransferase YhbS n=1 Tax=Actinacidiphila guanduensis TaxID=310781 RepID=A0A1H0P9F5_9ACTN|nr:GNAT family N-acetyltransferase [Actinacidiphila guanduensis]SDP01614.1 Predicted N-acetyltransferase YhbS [Actinacidiphila guanduensis]
MQPRARVRPIAADDWEAITALEARAYRPLGLSEERAVLQSKARSSPATCFALDAAGRSPAGYLLALPYPESAAPSLTAREERVFRSRNLHLHDLVVAEELRGRGYGRLLLRRLAGQARRAGYERISLVAVGGSRGFWAANGFTARDGEVAGYGPGAVYMSMALPRPGDHGRHVLAGHPRGAGREEAGRNGIVRNGTVRNEPGRGERGRSDIGRNENSRDLTRRDESGMS